LLQNRQVGKEVDLLDQKAIFSLFTAVVIFLFKQKRTAVCTFS